MDASAESDLERDFERFTDNIWEHHRGVALATLIGPAVVIGTAGSFVAIASGIDGVQKLMATVAATFFFFGRFIILGGVTGAGDETFLSAGQLAMLVFGMDVLTAVVLSVHAGVLFRVPWLGERLRELVHGGCRLVQSNPWAKRLTWLGVLSFVMFPLAATGSIGGSIFGRLLGLTRTATFLAVVTGSAIGCGVMYWGAAVINRYLDRDNPIVTIAGVSVVVLIILLLNHRYRRMTR